jgi:hypothetical protein
LKTIDTLVDDIYAVISSGIEVDEYRTEAFGRDVGITVTERITPSRRDPTLRASNLGTPCERKLWYSINQPERGSPLPPAAKLKFLFGDILEHELLFLAEVAGHTVTHRQREVSINGIVGHIDAVIDGVLVDCKSASSFAFQKFKQHGLVNDDPFGYIDQLNFYHYAARYSALEVDPNRFAFLVIDKTLGHICLDVHQPNGVDYSKIVEQKKEMVRGAVPKRSYFDEPDGKSGNRKLGTVCGYCDFKSTCWPTLRTFLYANGPRYLTNVVKVPDVPEVFGPVDES